MGTRNELVDGTGGLQNHPTSVIWIGNHWSWGTQFWKPPENGGMTSIFQMNGIGNCRTCYSLWLPQVGRILPCQIWLPVAIHETNMSCNWTWMEFHMKWIGNQSVTKTQRSTDAVFKWWTPKHPKTIGIFRLKSLVLAMKTWPCRDDFKIPPWLGPRFQSTARLPTFSLGEASRSSCRYIYTHISTHTRIYMIYR